MTTKQVLIAVQTDADLCNALDPPKAGAQGARGLQIVIPGNFAALIASGQEVPGCTYARVETDGSLYVTDRAQAQIAIPAVVNALSAPLQAEAATLQAKLITAVVVSAQVAQQQDISTG